MNGPSAPVAQVWKELVPVGGLHTVQWPVGAQVVHVDAAGLDVVAAWFRFTGPPEVEHVKRVPRALQVFGTGEPIPVRSAHLGTAVTGFGLVWHLVELLPQGRPL